MIENLNEKLIFLDLSMTRTSKIENLNINLRELGEFFVVIRLNFL